MHLMILSFELIISNFLQYNSSSTSHRLNSTITTIVETQQDHFLNNDAYFPNSGCHVKVTPVPSGEEYNPIETFSILMR
jgi:hypothetical protein